jgi:hypothetical protein
MPLIVPLLLEMVANASLVAGFILGVRVTLFVHDFLKKSL